MIRKNIRFAAGVIAGLLLMIPAAGVAQQNVKDSYPDMGIMNSVLEQLLRETDGKTHYSFNVCGSYLPGYGLIFVVTRGIRFFHANLPLDTEALKATAMDFSMSIVDSVMKEVDKAMKKHDSTMALHESFKEPHVPDIRIHAPRAVVRNFEENERKGLTKEEMGRLDHGVIKFLESYADAENRLSPGQHISIVVLTGVSSPARYYTIAKKQIANFRSGSETNQVFRQNVKIANLQEKHESVEIMGTILDKAIGSRMPGGIRSIFGPQTTGIYVKGLGTFFVCSMTELPDFGDHRPKAKPDKAGTAELENRIVRALGTYGSSLRFLPADESVLVSLRVDRFGTSNQDILVGLKKKEIDSYMRNEISFDALRKSAMIVRN